MTLEEETSHLCVGVYLFIVVITIISVFDFINFTILDMSFKRNHAEFVFMFLSYYN